ncbi:hypothetical protein RJT34_14703 [Clitoria ternatea]|uniref:Ubiquitin-like protease family profile domain-containing protein n=1 Tax=Clitoria ternatea TaxID=43366 RepID=A0AAN9PMP0_CLITE
MGVMTSNRKRPEECMNFNHHTNSNSNSPRKKPKLSTRPVSSSISAVARLSRYPEAKPPLAREVHAPCRPQKFELSRTESRRDMGNALFGNCEKAKRSALAKCRSGLWPKGKEVVIDLEDEREEPGFVSYEDSSVEEDEKVRVFQQQSTSTATLGSELTNGDLKVVSGGKEFASDISSVDAYKKLLLAVGRRSDTIQRIHFEIELNEKRRDTYNLLRSKKELVEEVPREPFVSLTDEEEDEVARAFSASWKRILVSHKNSNIDISGEKFQCLRPGGWLNDEVINVYLELLKERELREPQKFLKCHFFNTFFYKKLTSAGSGYDFKSVRRWTSQRKLGYGLLECDKIFVPIHQEIHWCLAVINKKEEKFQYLDSLKGMDQYVLKVLAKYFVDEVKDKTGKDIDVSTWEKEFVEDLPEQENGFDCGMFLIKYADFYSRGLRLCFNQEHMPYFRLRTAKEILRLKAE